VRQVARAAGRSVLEQHRLPPVLLLTDAHQHLDGVTRHHIVAARRHHPDDSVRQRCMLIHAPNAANDSNVCRNVVVGEDRVELLGDGRASVHLAAVETDDECTVNEAVGVRLCVLSIARIQDHLVEAVEVVRSAQKAMPAVSRRVSCSHPRACAHTFLVMLSVAGGRPTRVELPAD
jgi:hypothetical protein